MVVTGVRTPWYRNVQEGSVAEVPLYFDCCLPGGIHNGVQGVGPRASEGEDTFKYLCYLLFSDDGYWSVVASNLQNTRLKLGRFS